MRHDEHDEDDEPGRSRQTGELNLDDTGSVDLDAATRDALAAVEAVRSRRQDAADAGDATGSAGAPKPPEAPDAPEGNQPLGGDVARLESEIADLRDRSIRTLADFDNFRKRTEREREDARRYALAEVLRDVLPVVDNLDLALGSGGPADDLKRGVEMIRRQLLDMLRRHGVAEIHAAGERFDPALHEAVSRHEDAAVEAPTVVEDLRRGYRLHERLLRPTMVRVAVPPAGSTGSDV